MSDFLFELGVEELPYKAVGTLSQALTKGILLGLEKAAIAYNEVEIFATPRRLGLLLKDLPETSAPKKILRRGPALTAAYDSKGQPTQALLGFVRSCQIEIEDLVTTKTDKGEWLVYESMTQAIKTAELLPEIVKTAIAHLSLTKSMRWGEGDYEFVRPVHWVLMLWGSEVLPCELFGIKSGAMSYGHRFHAPHPIHIHHPLEYVDVLQDAYVIPSFAKRRSLILKGIEREAAKIGATALIPSDLVDEVCSIVEWPQVLTANFDLKFLQVPREVLIASMQVHQKCFALEDKNGRLLPHFIAVSNIVSQDPKQVIAGNEKVMHARLSDADFFFQQDKKQSLEHWVALTGKVVFQARLGTLLDKTKRMQANLQALISPLGLDREEALRAASFAKADLMSGMVGEFPELQGIMGSYYAREAKESLDLSLALREQYLPRFSGDKLPKTRLGLALSLVDRLDTLVGLMAIGQKPKGDSDPFKLRRYALGIARLLLSQPIALSLTSLLETALQTYGLTESAQLDNLIQSLNLRDVLAKSSLDPELHLVKLQSLTDGSKLIQEAHDFIFERLQTYYQGKGLSYECLMAVKAVEQDRLYDFSLRLTALADFIEQDAALSLALASKRVGHLLAQVSSQTLSISQLAPEFLAEHAEKDLYYHLIITEEKVKPLYLHADYPAIFALLAHLKKPIDTFFEHVLVMDADINLQTNRLALLLRLQKLLQGVADISLLALK